jgi:putative DNA methylase
MQYDLGPVEVKKRNHVPHWVTPRSIYFVTWHLADALPAEFREALRREIDYGLELIRTARGTLTIANRMRLERERRRKIERCLDGGSGACSLRDPHCAAIVTESLKYFNAVRYDLLAWSVMPNHAHVVFTCRDGFSLPELVKSWKNYSSREVNRLLGRGGTLWQEDYFDRSIRNPRQLQRTLEYVVNNPSSAGLIEWPFVANYPEAINRHF